MLLGYFKNEIDGMNVCFDSVIFVNLIDSIVFWQRRYSKKKRKLEKKKTKEISIELNEYS